LVRRVAGRFRSINVLGAWQHQSMATVELQITGMTCGHCVMSVTEELEALGATEVDVVLNKGGLSIAQVTSPNPLSEADLAAAIAEAGYQMVAAN